jgi:hypothetical protein
MLERAADLFSALRAARCVSRSISVIRLPTLPAHIATWKRDPVGSSILVP